jgi:hypothetical protein
MTMFLGRRIAQAAAVLLLACVRLRARTTARGWTPRERLQRRGGARAWRIDSNLL